MTPKTFKNIYFKKGIDEIEAEKGKSEKRQNELKDERKYEISITRSQARKNV